LTLGGGNKTKLDVDPFPANVNMTNFEEKRILVQTSQAASNWGKNVIVSDEPQRQMATI
jgi:hypothetical protein